MNKKKLLIVFLMLAFMLVTVFGVSFAMGAEGEPAAETEPQTVTITDQQTSGKMTVTLTVPERAPIPYIEADGTPRQTGPNCYDVYQTDTSLGIKSTEQWYVLRENMTLSDDITLKILGNVKLIVCDGVTFSVPKGINLDNGTLTVYYQSTDPQTKGKFEDGSPVYLDTDGTVKRVTTDYYDVKSTDTSLGANGTTRWYVLRESMALADEDCLNILGHVKLIISDGATLTVSHGINTDGGSITVYAQSADPASMGKLIANAHNDNCAAIGSSGVNNPGSITINGGDITATGSTSGAAIGGGAGKTNVNVNINGGVVHATGIGDTAAISGNITVNGGTVTANGGENAAAISGNITVNGGTVNATGGENSAAIQGGTITVNGGIVTAMGEPVLSGIPTFAENIFAKAGDSEGTAVNTDNDQLGDKNYLYIAHKHTVKWLMDNGSLLDTTKEWDGDIPKTNVIPNKGADAQYSYTFAGWTPEIIAATEDATYTAVFSHTVNTYTVTWKNIDGTISGTDFTFNNAGYAKIKVYDAEGYYYAYELNVTLVSSVLQAGQYIRMGTYNGVPIDWYCQRINGTGIMMPCKYALKTDKFGSNATYKSSNVHAWLDGTFATDIGLTKGERSIVRSVNLSGSAGDGTDTFIIPAYGNDELNSGQQVKAPYNINNQSSLVNTYWLRTARDTSNARIINHSKDGSPVATVAARYSGVGNSQWIRPMFYLAGDTFLKLICGGTGTEDDPFIIEPKYIVSANNPANGTVSITATRDSTTINSGSTPAGVAAKASVKIIATPATGYQLKSLKVQTADGTNIALSDNTFTMPYKNVIITAEFEKQKFDVVWKNYDGTVLEIDKVECGVMPTCDGGTPTKPGTEDCFYTFSGWTPEVVAATQNTTYTATFTETRRFAAVTANGNTTKYFTLDEALENWTDGSTLTLLDDVSYSTAINVPADTSKTLDLNGKTLTVGTRIGVYGTLTIQSSASGGNIKISVKGQVIAVVAGATLNIESGTITGYNSNNAVIGLSGTCNLNGGKVTTPASNAFSTNAGSVLNLTGGEIVCTSASTDMSKSSAILGHGNSTINWTGTAITTNNGDGIRMKTAGAGTVNVSGGSFTATTANPSADGAYAIYNNFKMGTLNIQGNPELNGRSVYLESPKIINITGTLSNTTPITVTMQTSGVFMERRIPESERFHYDAICFHRGKHRRRNG